MSLTCRTKQFLEILLYSGLDVIEFTANPKSLLYDAVGWSSARSARRHLSSLRARNLIEVSEERSTGSWVARLTGQGRKQIFDVIVPEKAWRESWNGKWTSLSFDLPKNAATERKRLAAWLKSYRFGHLQGSLWISHRAYSTWTDELESKKIDPKAVLFHQIMPLGRIRDHEYVDKAWPFDEINRRYSVYLSFLNGNPPDNSGAVSDWIATESRLWNAAFELDPFLPNELLPKSYPGKRAFSIRKKVISQWIGSLLKAEE